MIYSLNIPTLLTLIRLVGSPLLLPFLIVYLLPYNLLWLNYALAVLCGCIGATDMLDGFLARRYGQETILGTMLDPIADKFFLYTVLVALLTIGKIYFYWVIIFIGREFFIMGLRHVALENQLQVPVSRLGKLKTMMLTCMLMVMVANPYQAEGWCGAPYWNGIEYSTIAISLVLSLVSAAMYCLHFIRVYAHTRGNV